MAEVFKDGEKKSCIVKLKNRAQLQDDEEKEWYECAFGAKQNIMTARIVYTPLSETMKKNKSDLYARIKYKMFPELIGEFNLAEWPSEKDYLIIAVEAEKPDGQKDASLKVKDKEYDYRQEIEFPYGTLDIEYFH